MCNLVNYIGKAFENLQILLYFPYKNTQKSNEIYGK